MFPALFPAITMIAHALEGYIDTGGKVGPLILPPACLSSRAGAGTG